MQKETQLVANIQDLINLVSSAQDTDHISFGLDNSVLDINVSDFRTKFNIYASRTEYVITNELNVREKPTIKAKVVGKLEYGDKIVLLPEPSVIADTHTWQHISIGWIAGEFVSSVAPPNINPVVTSNKKIGLHVLDGDYKSLLATAQRLYNNKTPIKALTVMDVSAANLFRPYVPVINMRVYKQFDTPEYEDNFDSAYNSGYNYVSANIGLLSGLQHSAYTLFQPVQPSDFSIYVQFTNEQKFRAFDYAFYYGVAKALERWQLRGCLFNDGVGQPEVEQMLVRSDGLVESGTKRMFEFMNDNGHIYGIHQYSSPKSTKGPGEEMSDNEYYGFRFIDLFKSIPVKPHILITECGEYVPKASDDTVTEMSLYNDLLLQYSEVIAANWWTFNNGGDVHWDASNLANYLPKIETFLSK